MAISREQLYRYLAENFHQSITPLLPHENMQTFRQLLKSDTEFWVFGTGSACKQMLSRMAPWGLRVTAYIDNNSALRGTYLDGVPVYHPSEVDVEAWKSHPTIIASMYFREIANQLQGYGLASYQHFFVYHAFLFENNVMSQGYGTEMEQHCLDHWEEFEAVLGLLREATSKFQFLRYLYMRLMFLVPERWLDELFSVTSFEQLEAIRLSQKLKDPLRTAFTNMVRDGIYDFGTPDCVKVALGDRVVDGGAWLGDSTLDFVLKAGPHGHVFAFEPTSRHLEHLAQTLQTLSLQDRVTLVNKGLWTGAETLSFVASDDYFGAGDFVVDGGQCQIQTIDLDSYFQEQPVDFIKLDIEGSELKALRGAEKLLKAHKPKLAICLYHQPQDLYEIPLYLDSLGLGYQFYFRHQGNNPTDAILYAKAKT